MPRHRLYFTVGVLGLLLTGTQAAYLESGDSTPPMPAIGIPPPRPIPRPPPPPHRGQPALARLAPRLVVGAPRRERHLTVYPLLLDDAFSRSTVLTLDEALERRRLVIHEKETAAVPSVRVRNHAGQAVFLMAGELILGGKQDRMIRDNVLLPPHSGWIEVPVYCGERDRWRDAGDAFRSEGALSPPSLRGLAAQQAGQDQIWTEIDRQLDDAGVRSPTRRYQELYDHPDRQRDLERCVAFFHDFPTRRTVGCVVISGHRILGCEVFSDPDLFARLWPKILRSYAIDAMTPGTGRSEPMPLPSTVRDRRVPWPDPVHRFLDHLTAARYQGTGTPGIGHAWRLTGPVSGTSLDTAGSLIHASVFPALRNLTH